MNCDMRNMTVGKCFVEYKVKACKGRNIMEGTLSEALSALISVEPVQKAEPYTIGAKSGHRRVVCAGRRINGVVSMVYDAEHYSAKK